MVYIRFGIDAVAIYNTVISICLIETIVIVSTYL